MFSRCYFPDYKCIFLYSWTSLKRPPKMSNQSGWLREVGAYKRSDHRLISYRVWKGGPDPAFLLLFEENPASRVWFAFAARTFTWVVTLSRIPDRQAKKSHIPCPNFGESHFPGSSQIPNPVKTFCVFPNPAPYFGQIPDPENTLPDPVPGLDSFRCLFSLIYTLADRQPKMVLCNTKFNALDASRD